MVRPLSGVSASLILAVSVSRSPMLASVRGWFVRGGVTVIAPTVGGAFGPVVGVTNVKPPASVPVRPPTDTRTSTAPAAWAGTVAVMVVALTTVTLVAVAGPICTGAPAAEPDPVIVTVVPPTLQPVLGEMAVTATLAGGGAVGLPPPHDAATSDT